MPGEFQLIEQYFRPLCGPEALALTDDAACFSTPEGFDLVVTKDLLLEGVHFREDDPVDSIAHKALAVNVSDCVAKGAQPHLYWLGLALPERTNEKWVEAFARGLGAAQAAFNCRLAGGDTTRSSNVATVSITLIGLVPSGQMIKRSGAKPGDDVYVTGVLGDGAMGLWCLQNDHTTFDQLVTAYQAPLPPVKFGSNLVEVANASADISDGLVADLEHIAHASSVSIMVKSDKLPKSEQGEELLSRFAGLSWMQWSGGDDYQIAFTAPREHRDHLQAVAERADTRITRIGCVAEGNGVQLLDKHGEIMQISHKGYTHF